MAEKAHLRHCTTILLKAPKLCCSRFLPVEWGPHLTPTSRTSGPTPAQLPWSQGTLHVPDKPEPWPPWAEPTMLGTCWEALSIWGPLCPPCPVMCIIHVHRNTNGFRSGLKAATSRGFRPSNLVILPGRWAPNAQLQGWKRKPPSAFEPAPVPNLFREIQALITL